MGKPPPLETQQLSPEHGLGDALFPGDVPARGSIWQSSTTSVLQQTSGLQHAGSVGYAVQGAPSTALAARLTLGC